MNILSRRRAVTIFYVEQKAIPRIELGLRHVLMRNVTNALVVPIEGVVVPVVEPIGRRILGCCRKSNWPCDRRSKS